MDETSLRGDGAPSLTRPTLTQKMPSPEENVPPSNPRRSRPERLLLTSVFGPYGVADGYAEGLGMQMELMDNQITRGQGLHSPRASYWSFALYLLAENTSVPTTVLDFPTWDEFTRELRRGYTHVGISFIAPNVYKARRMACYIRDHHPATRILLGGHGTAVPDLQALVPHDDLCAGEGIRWLRTLFRDDPEAPIRHPVMPASVNSTVYGFPTASDTAIVVPGVGCVKGCAFCATSHKFDRQYVPLLRTGAEVFDVCRRAEEERSIRRFGIYDENFLTHPETARELLRCMEQARRTYTLGLFSSADTVRAVGVDFLVRLGVVFLWIGVESRRAGFAKNAGTDLAALVADLQDHGISVVASTILFLDHHDRTSIQEDIDWAIGLKSDMLQFMGLIPFPGTALFQRLVRDRRLPEPPPYTWMHGQGALTFSHPAFAPEEPPRIIADAFRRKYETHGPSSVAVAETYLRGFVRARDDVETRRRSGARWNPDTLRYEPGTAPGRDEYMDARVALMEREARALRPVTLAARLFAPNQEARRRCDELERLYRQSLGAPTTRDRALAVGLAGLAAVEAARTRGGRALLRQPPCRRTEYR